MSKLLAHYFSGFAGAQQQGGDVNMLKWLAGRNDGHVVDLNF